MNLFLYLVVSILVFPSHPALGQVQGNHTYTNPILDQQGADPSVDTPLLRHQAKNR
jgi:hypothetical protein